MQDAIMKHLKRTATMQGDMPVDDIDSIISEAVLHNLQQQQPECEWIDLTDALRGPAHVAKMLVRRCQERRSTPTRPYKLNEEQLQCIALFVNRLEQAFLEDAWLMVNDTYRTDLCLLFPPYVIALGVLFALGHAKKQPDKIVAYLQEAGVDDAEVRHVCMELVNLYTKLGRGHPGEEVP